MVWKSSDEPAPKKFKAVKSVKKLMCSVFQDFKGVIHEEYFEPTKTNKTITAAHYCDTLMRLRTAVKRKRPGLLSHSVILLHDNARPHSATITRLLLEDFKWDVFQHSPYSPDLTPSDYHLFLQLKSALGGLRFQSNAEVIAWCRKFFQNLDTANYSRGISKLVDRFEKCLEKYGDYVEKQSTMSPFKYIFSKIFALFSTCFRRYRRLLLRQPSYMEELLSLGFRTKQIEKSLQKTGEPRRNH